MSRVFHRASVMPGTDCWEWQGCLDAEGYGRVNVDNMSRLAHRIAWTETNGDPGNLYVCHKCDNRRCVNPDHLFLGTAMDNTRDMLAKGRQVKPRPCIGSESPNAKITEADAREIHDLYATGKWTHRQLGDRFGIHACSAARVLRGTTWAHVAADR